MARGLCTTCVRAPTCTLSNKNGPVWHCEEFEPGPPHLPEKVAAARPRPTKPTILGLCDNCAHRDDCTFQRPEGGVWHCEEYE